MDKLAKIALEYARDYSGLKQIKRIQGGSVNEAFYIETAQSSYFMKHHSQSPKYFFKSESQGLRQIKETNTISVPNFLSYSDQPGKAFLLLEWIEGEKNDQTDIRLGRNLAKLHKCVGRMHGFTDDSYIGILHQPNTLSPSWLEYYREYRLKSQLDLGVDKGFIQGKRRTQLELLLQRLDKWLPEIVEPSYLHGDLWGGNWIVGPGGEPYLVDPSFLYGDRQFEIAFTELFGGFSQQFYESYKEVYPLRDDYQDVKPLYQLYYLLVHLNMFGETYGARVDEILAKYVGD